MRFRFLFTFLCWLVTAPAWAATLDQQVAGSSFSASPTFTLTGGVDAGDTLVILVSTRNTTETVTAASDPTNGAWTCPAGANITYTNSAVGICYFLNSASSSGADLTVTLTKSAASWSDVNLSEWSGISGGLDQLNESTDTASPYTHGSITTTGAGVILTVSTQNTSGTETANASFNALTNNTQKDYFQYWITSGAQTTDGAYTLGFSTDTSGAIISFLDSAGGATVNFFPRRLQVNP